uniref:Kelch like family member 10 n=1 Tax=Cynoglossus semilaevis TaxID=244447 RepID=A0A3P8VPR9_CYNSE
MSWFNEYRLQGKFCDALIKVENVEYKIHKVIISDCSPYFIPFFEFHSSTDASTFDMFGLCPDTMRLIIEFAYTGSVSVTECNVEKLMLASDMLNIMSIVQVCSDFLGEQLSPENSIGIWKFSKVCSCPELQLRASHYIFHHFEEVFSCEEFLHLTMQELNEILGRDELSVKKEGTVFEAILHWVAHKPKERCKNLAMLFSKFRVALTSAQYIHSYVLTNEFVRSNAECIEMVSDAVKTIHQSKFSDGTVLRDPLARPRLPGATLLAIGGCSDERCLGEIEAYNVCADLWVTLPNTLTTPRADHGTAFLNGYVYVVGGFDGEVYCISVSRLDLVKHTWQDVAPMYHCRGLVSVTVLNGFIYAMGGYDGYNQIRSAECYSPEIDEWKCIAPMCQWRSEAGSTTLDDKIYICGGFKGQTFLQTAECYNPNTNQWTMITPMIRRRCEHGVVAHAGCVYAVGGNDGICCLNCTEVFNPQNNTWHMISSMKTPRSKFGLGVINGQIYAVGGRTGAAALDWSATPCAVVSVFALSLRRRGGLTSSIAQTLKERNKR